MGECLVVAHDERPRIVGVGAYRAIVVDALPFAQPKKAVSRVDTGRLRGVIDRASGSDGRDADDGDYAVVKSHPYGRGYLVERMNGRSYRTDLLNAVRRRWPKCSWRTIDDGQFFAAVAFDGGRCVGVVCGNRAED